MYTNELRNKPIENTKCPKCKVYNNKYVKCRCQLKDPKKFPCKNKTKFAFIYSYTILIWWKSSEKDAEELREDIEVFADVDIYENPFQHCVFSVTGSYYNLSRAEKIEILTPCWNKFHLGKNGNIRGYEYCYCDDDVNIPEDEDFK